MKNAWHGGLALLVAALGGQAARGQQQVTAGFLTDFETVVCNASTDHLLTNACEFLQPFSKFRKGFSEAESPLDKELRCVDEEGMPSIARGDGVTKSTREGVATEKYTVDCRAKAEASNDAETWAMTAGTASAVHSMGGVGRTPPDDAVFLAVADLTIECDTDDSSDATGFVECGKAWIQMDPSGDTTSVKPFIEDGKERYLVRFEAAGWGHSFGSAQIVPRHANTKTTATMDVLAYANANAGQSDSAEVTGKAKLYARAYLYSEAHPPRYRQEPDESEYETIITPTFVQWVTDEYPGDANTIDVFSGPPEPEQEEEDDGDGDGEGEGCDPCGCDPCGYGFDPCGYGCDF